MKLKTFTYFYPEKPRLAQLDTDLVLRLDQNPEWIAEPKYNGARLMLHVIDGNYFFWSRHNDLLAWTPTPEIVRALDRLKLSGYWLFDGELRHNKVVGVKNKVVLYDLFICENTLLINKPFKERRGILDALFHYNGLYDENLDLAPQYQSGFKEVFSRLTTDPEIEGLVLKNLNGKLQPGRARAVESSWMIKLRKPSGRYNF